MRFRSPLIILMPLAIIAAGCGGGDDASDTTDSGSNTGGGNTVRLDVKPGALEYAEGEASAEAGTVTLRSTNPDEIEHNIAIEGDGVSEEGELVSNGDTSEITVDLKPGEYELYCTPHRAAGMVATLTVT